MAAICAALLRKVNRFIAEYKKLRGKKCGSRLGRASRAWQALGIVDAFHHPIQSLGQRNVAFAAHSPSHKQCPQQHVVVAFCDVKVCAISHHHCRIGDTSNAGGGMVVRGNGDGEEAGLHTHRKGVVHPHALFAGAQHRRSKSEMLVEP